MYVCVRAGACTLEASTPTQWWLLAAGAIGALLYLLAPVLSTSSVFRLSAGSLVFTSGSLIILIILLFR